MKHRAALALPWQRLAEREVREEGRGEERERERGRREGERGEREA